MRYAPFSILLKAPEEIRETLFYQGKLNMTYVGLRFSKHINGVAKKHTEVSKSMFPGYHIESVTNGVHSGFWTSAPFQKLFDKYMQFNRKTNGENSDSVAGCSDYFKSLQE